MSRAIDQAWASILERLPADSPVIRLSAAEIKRWTGLEPRLMAKFDHQGLLPPALVRHGRFLLPVRNGEYALVRGQGYHRLEPTPAPVEFPSRAEFTLKTSQQGVSEMQHLDLAYNSGILSHFLEEPVLYPTIRGRKRCPRFTLSVSGQELEVEGVQVEVDGGYEGPRMVAVVEAKIKEPPDFHIRQLYYPFRFWSQTSAKPVRCLFFTYSPSDRLARIREYRFLPAEVYASPRLVKAATYRLVARPGRLASLPSPELAVRVPQADDLRKVARLPFLVAEGLGESGHLAEALDFTRRQSSYYREACEMLGLVEGYRLTRRGARYVELGVEARHELLCRYLLELPIMRQAVVEMLLSPDRRLDNGTLEQLIREGAGLTGTTVRRRARTVRSWFSWLADTLGFVRLDPDGMQLVASPRVELLSLF
ncbi:MAG: hypothetical protein HY319_27315 [Armatimonadetes bacterium]|nr:hypothetical protein [Armatimonadota bacterium]